MSSQVVILDEEQENVPNTKTGLYKNSKGGSELMYKSLHDHVDQRLLENFQIICSRVREIDPNKIPILWCHDTWNDPESAHLVEYESRKRFKQIVFVSHYQFLTYHLGLGVPYTGTSVLKNAIVPISHNIQKPTDKINLIYHTTPHRGLELLVPVFTYLAEQNKNIHLDVYSSFELYGWPQRDQPYQELFKVCKDHPQITYHGSQPNEIIREALKKAHIFAYPSIWQETSCIAAIEAMSAGALVVCPDYGALTETVSDYGMTYRWVENHNIHARNFASMLLTAINNLQNANIQNVLANAQKRVNVLYNWENRKIEWTKLLESLLDEKETKQ